MRRIGITCSHRDWPAEEANRARLERYIAAVGDAGGAGEMVWLPAEGADMAARATELAAQLDGLILSGGGDLPASAYGEETLSAAPFNPIIPERPAFEERLLEAFAARDKPILGICYGCQLLNVWQGGTLVQDIPLQVATTLNHSDMNHGVRLAPASRLRAIIGLDEFEVVSAHHQAVARVAPTALQSAAAPDGVVEAIELSGPTFALGVQWHPERDRESVATRSLFAAFLAA